MFKDGGDSKYSLLLMMISSHYIYLSAMISIRFEDFGTTNDGKRFLNIY